MILETTNPKYQTRPQISARAKFAFRTSDRADLEFMGEGSRSMSRGVLQTEQFVDRKPHERPQVGANREPEPDTRSRPRGSSLCLFNEAPDAPLWLIVDRTTGHVFARVRGSLPWVVDQLRLAAHQLGGYEQDLYFRKAN